MPTIPTIHVSTIPIDLFTLAPFLAFSKCVNFNHLEPYSSVYYSDGFVYISGVPLRELLLGHLLDCLLSSMLACLLPCLLVRNRS